MIPADLRAHSVGPRLSALCSYLVGGHGVSKRGVEEIARDVFGAPIALGTVANLEQETSAALAPAYQQAIAAVREAPVKNVDETGWKQNGKKRWLWLAATAGGRFRHQSVAQPQGIDATARRQHGRRALR